MTPIDRNRLPCPVSLPIHTIPGRAGRDPPSSETEPSASGRQPQPLATARHVRRRQATFPRERNEQGLRGTAVARWHDAPRAGPRRPAGAEAR